MSWSWKVCRLTLCSSIQCLYSFTSLYVHHSAGLMYGHPMPTMPSSLKSVHAICNVYSPHVTAQTLDWAVRCNWYAVWGRDWSESQDIVQREIRLSLLNHIHKPTRLGGNFGIIQKARPVADKMPARLPELVANMGLSESQKQDLLHARQTYCDEAAIVFSERQQIVQKLRLVSTFGLACGSRPSDMALSATERGLNFLTCTGGEGGGGCHRASMLPNNVQRDIRNWGKKHTCTATQAKRNCNTDNGLLFSVHFAEGGGLRNEWRMLCMQHSRQSLMALARLEARVPIVGTRVIRQRVDICVKILLSQASEQQADAYCLAYSALEDATNAQSELQDSMHSQSLCMKRYATALYKVGNIQQPLTDRFICGCISVSRERVNENGLKQGHQHSHKVWRMSCQSNLLQHNRHAKRVLLYETHRYCYALLKAFLLCESPGLGHFNYHSQVFEAAIEVLN